MAEQKKKRKSQNEKVLEYMVEHGIIDNVRAASDLSIYRLSARIFELKECGIPINTVIKYGNKPDGAPTHWAEYSVDRSYFINESA